MPKPECIEIDPPNDQVFLLTSDGTESTSAVVASLQKKGWKNIAVIVFPTEIVPRRIALPPEITEVVLTDIDCPNIQTQLESIVSRAGHFGSFLHLHPYFAPDYRINDSTGPESKLLKYIYFMAQALSKDLNSSCLWGRKCFVTATRLDGLMGLGQDRRYSPLGGGLFGLTKTINLEWKPVFCRTVDFHPDQDTEKFAEQLTAEIYDANLSLLETGYRDEERYTISTVLSPKMAEDVLFSSGVTAKSVFIVPGGAKGITAACVLELARLYCCGFILIGRTEAMAEEPPWAQGCFEDTEMKRRILEHLCSEQIKPTPLKISQLQKAIDDSRKVRQTLKTIEEYGSKAVYIRADITDSEKIQKELSRSAESLGTITGVIYGAGVLADKRIEKKTENDFDRIFATKVVGLGTILELIPMNQLQHFVVFASAAGFYGNEAQSDYALANEILNKQAHQIKLAYPDCHAIAFNWGPWDGGMVTPQLKQLFHDRNIKIIPTEVGSRIFAAEFANPDKSPVQLVIGSSMAVSASGSISETTHREVHTHLALSDNEIVRNHTIAGEPVLPFVFALSWMARICEQQFPGYRLHQCRDSRVLKGIVFNDSASGEYTLSIRVKEVMSSDLILEVKIASDRKRKRPIFHYTSEIYLTPQSGESDFFYRLKPDNSHPISGETLYRDGTLFHGPALRMVRKIDRVDADNITVTCMIDPISSEDQGQFPTSAFNHFADDALLQSVVVWARQQYGNASLPLTIKKGSFFRPTPFQKPFRVSADIIRHNESQVISDITACDLDGRVYTQLHGVEVTLSKSLNEKFLHNLHDS